MSENSARLNTSLLVVGGPLLALLLTWLLWPVMEPNPLVFFIVAVAIGAWYGGLGRGLATTLVSVVALYPILLQYSEQGWLIDGYNASRLGLFVLVGLLLSGSSERRRRAERALHRSNETLARLYESASEAIVIADEQGRIMQVNAAAETMFGYRREELTGQALEVLVPPALRARHVRHRAAYTAEPRNRSMGSGMDLRAVRQDGSELPVEISLSYVRDGEGLRVMAFVTDISARKEAEAALEEYQERLRQLAFEAVMSEERERRRIAVDLHDRIGQALALCQIKLGGVRERADDRLTADLDRCIRLVETSVEDTRSLTFELSPPVLYDLGFEAAVRWLGDQMHSEHDFRVHVEGGAIPPLEDELAALLFRTVRELLLNAIKHARTDAATVQLKPTDEGLEMVVSDQGVGFEVAQLDRQNGTRASFGLFSIQEQIERVGGSAIIHSTPGDGTQVHITVPVTAAQPLESEAGS